MPAAPDDLLVDHVSGTAGRELSKEVQEKAVHSLLDALSLAVAAREHPVVAAVEALSPPLGEGGVTSWASGARQPVPNGCLVNGVAVHAFFQDDTDMTAWAHPASLIVPVAVGAVESTGGSLLQALKALVAGYTTLTWLGADQVVAKELVGRGFRTSPTLGAIAASAAGAAALGLDAEQTRSAIGIAADSTGGVLEPVRDGAQDWRLQNGFACQRGAYASLLAQQGVRGPSLPLTGPRGFLQTFTTGGVPPRWSSGPTDESILGVWFKHYPTLGDNMAPVLAAAALTASTPPAADISEIVIHMNAHYASYPGTQFMGPFERIEQAIASTAFAVATLLARGRLAYADYDELRAAADIRELVSRVRIVPEEDLDYLQGSVEVHTKRGVLSSSADDMPRELFFRDRATTLAVLEGRHGTGVRGTCQQLFDWIDGAVDEPALGQLLADVQSWRVGD